MDKELYKRSVKKIKELRDDPMKLEAAMGRATSDSLPILNDAMQGTVTRAFTYLSEKVPELAPQAPFDLYEPEPTPEQMENFDAAVRVINDPINTYFYHLATNTLSPQVTEPFQAIYPDLYARVTDAAMEVYRKSQRVTLCVTRTDGAYLWCEYGIHGLTGVRGNESTIVRSPWSRTGWWR